MTQFPENPMPPADGPSGPVPPVGHFPSSAGAYPPPAPGAYIPAPQGGPTARNTLGLIAIIVAAVGFVLACIPFATFFAWFLLVPAFVLSIIALVQKNKTKGLAIAALIVSIVGGIVAIAVALVSALVIVGSTIENSGGSNLSSEDSGTVFSIGETATTSDGVEFTVTESECGLTSADTSYNSTETATGEFCAVSFTVKNGDDESIALTTSNATGYIGETAYMASPTLGNFGNDSTFTTLNPGLSVDSTVYFDVPAGSELDTINLNTGLGLGDGVTFNLK